MFERKFIFQEGDASGWLLLYLAGAGMALLILAFRGMARAGKPKRNRPPRARRGSSPKSSRC